MAVTPRRASKSGFLDKVLTRIGRLDREGLQTVVERLARERQFLETLFNTIEDGVIVTDESGRIVYLNAAACRILGIHSEAAEDQPVQRFLPQLDWNRIARHDSQGGSGVVREELEIQYPRRRFLRLYATPLDGEATGSSGVALILNDATEIQQETSAAIESERLHALTLLAASVAHEIGNPLNALHIHLQLLERDLKRLKTLCLGTAASSRGRHRAADIGEPVTELTDKLQGYLGVAQGEIARLDYIITQFLQALRPKPPRFENASLNDTVRETLKLLGPELANRGLEVQERLFRSLPACRLDPDQIKQVLVNLVKNAMHSMTKGGILTMTTGATPDDVWVSISDTGSGIPPEQQRVIFEPFYTTKKKGTGLGLMIVERIMREHGGRIELTSQVGKGTTFKLWLPLPGRGPKLLEVASPG